MIPFRTSIVNLIVLPELVRAMQDGGVDPILIADAARLARTDQGVYDLMAMWGGSWLDQVERDEVLNEIRRSIDDYRGIL